MTGVNVPLHIVFIFLDGVGIGPADQRSNPFSHLSLPNCSTLAGNQKWTDTFTPIDENDHVFKQIDARLNVPGLPQSGTGQATLFTGKNCALLAGKHFGPFPHSKTRATIARDNVFQQVNQIKFNHPEPSAFANAYPRQFFEKARSRNRWTVTTLCCMEAQIPVRTIEELQENRAVTADITRAAWRSHLSLPVEVIDEQTAARHLAALSASHPFTLFEYYLTDKAGHSQSPEEAERILSSIDALLGGMLDVMDFSRTLLLLTSDHGNIEDLSTKSHTMNAVPLAALGKGAHHFREATSLMDITPAIVKALTHEREA